MNEQDVIAVETVTPKCLLKHEAYVKQRLLNVLCISIIFDISLCVMFKDRIHIPTVEVDLHMNTTVLMEQAVPVSSTSTQPDTQLCN